MSRLQTVCRAAGATRETQAKLLLPYLVCGDPDEDTTLRLMHQLVQEGADIIELGFPFSDPASDGPVIQQAAERSIAAGGSLQQSLAVVGRFRQSNQQTPVVLMGYLNPLERMGYGAFAHACAANGVDGVLIVDLPPFEAAPLKQELARHAIDSIFLVAPTSGERAQDIAEQCSGYLYYVSLKGVTGAQSTEAEKTIAARIKALRGLTSLPIVIGFGIKDPASAAAMASLADGVVVGTALVERIAALGSEGGKRGKGQIPDSQILAATAIIGHIRQALDSL